MSNNSLILVGNEVTEDWEFRRGVEAATGENWDVCTCVINKYDGLKKYTRYLNYFFGPLRLFFKRKRYKKIISWEQFLGLILVFYMRIFHVKKFPEITIMALIYKPKRGFIGRVFEWFVRYTLSSRYIKQIIVYSKSEIEYYSGLFNIPKEKFRAETLGIADWAKARGEEGQPEKKYNNIEKYYISAGRSNRDYAFLRQAWPKDREKLYIVCDVEKSEDTENIRIT